MAHISKELLFRESKKELATIICLKYFHTKEILKTTNITEKDSITICNKKVAMLESIGSTIFMEKEGTEKKDISMMDSGVMDSKKVMEKRKLDQAPVLKGISRITFDMEKDSFSKKENSLKEPL